MSDKSRIEWTDATWNPITGCTPVSEGCEHCYAKRHAERFRGRFGYPAEDPFQVTFHEDRLEQPLRWKKPRKIFVCSMGDLFHEDVELEWLYKIFGVIARCPQHRFMVLTKRPARMREFFHAPISVPGHYGYYIKREGVPFEVFNHVWLGVTAENQRTADERIPILLQIPAAVRFVSAEPMLGPVNLSRWAHSIAMMPPENAPATWKEWNELHLWPDWVPEHWRKLIEDFWIESVGGRGPSGWLKDAMEQNCPPHGMTMLGKQSEETFKGRFLHTWNNMCVLVDEDGTARVTSTLASSLFDPGPSSGSYQNLNWVICGGESGPGARPMHPEWARSLRDQCIEAQVPFFFKQWGEWKSVEQPGKSVFLRRLAANQCVSKGGENTFILHTKVGKKAAGRLLDGLSWNESPAVKE